jgi:hypothetical protein
MFYPDAVPDQFRLELLDDDAGLTNLFAWGETLDGGALDATWAAAIRAVTTLFPACRSSATSAAMT